MQVSIIIKAFNEEANIGRAIEFALAALNEVESGEVIIADSLSSDRTVEIAQVFPVRIVQLINHAERCCGVGAEMGYRIAKGRYIYILDADMLLDADFLKTAVAYLENNELVAGVGGLIEEVNISNAEFRGRAASTGAHLKAGDVDRLNGGGLFRRSAVNDIGYLTNRNLHSFEEFELAVRLRAAGWRLVRLNHVAVKHFGHTDSSFRLLWRRWQGRYMLGGGELLRFFWSSPHFLAALRNIQIFRICAVIFCWWIALSVVIFAASRSMVNLWWIAMVLLSPLAATSLRRRSVVDGAYLLAFMNLFAIGTIFGFLSRPQGKPSDEFEMLVVK